MGNNDSLSNKKSQLLTKIKEIFDLKDKTKDYIIETYKSNYYSFGYKSNLQNWVQNILYYMDNIFNDKYEEISKLINEEERNQLEEKHRTKYEEKPKNNYLKPEKDHYSTTVIEKSDVFTSKDIQVKNLEITRQFMTFSTNFINDDDEIDNKTLGIKLIQVANISRKSYNDSNKLLAILYKEFEKEKEKDVIISSPEQFKKDFSNWVKNSKNKYIIEQNINKFTSTFSAPEANKEIKNYFDKLYKDLLILYLECELSFPPVMINFLQDEKDFNSKKMIDNFQIGKRYKAKVNFVFFPSLFSNGNYLENGKQWVFNYIHNEKKVTYHKDDLKLIPIIEDKEKFVIPKVADKLKVSLKKEILYTPKINYKFSDGVTKEFTVVTINKITKKTNKIIVNSSFKLDENEEITKFDLNI